MSDRTTKPALRKAALTRRDLIEPREAHAAAEAIARAALPLVAGIAAPGAVVSAYWPIRSELSTRPLLEALAAAGYATALPVMTATAKPLHFRRWSPGDPLDVGSLGLAEPLPAAAPATPVVLFTPLAAFDSRGHRIGYGGGSFDATLAALRAGRKTTAIGLAYATQEVERVPEEAHDQALDYILTEERLFAL
ncbi:MAG: 5-formyltetrahydrofolate cyclo-ligase [Hyphomicrobiales bacterium]|nr:5-formyltetrahydrofolate cyclo-ligase [Hyphomicrobiales bacterium]